MNNFSRGVAHVLLLAAIMLLASGAVGYLVYKKTISNKIPPTPPAAQPTLTPTFQFLDNQSPTSTLTPTSAPDDIFPSPTPTSVQKISIKKCVVGGCNSEICAEEPMSSICIYKAEYGCYKSALCEIQDDGNCGWTLTENLMLCLEKL